MTAKQIGSAAMHVPEKYQIDVSDLQNRCLSEWKRTGILGDSLEREDAILERVDWMLACLGMTMSQYIREVS